MLSDNASMVSAIITKTVQTIKALVPDLNMVHFWTDSPSSQYRNKLIFDMIANFENLHGCKASWHYFESGACEELGDLKKEMPIWQSSNHKQLYRMLMTFLYGHQVVRVRFSTS